MESHSGRLIRVYVHIFSKRKRDKGQLIEIVQQVGFENEVGHCDMYINIITKLRSRATLMLKYIDIYGLFTQFKYSSSYKINGSLFVF